MRSPLGATQAAGPSGRAPTYTVFTAPKTSPSLVHRLGEKTPNSRHGVGAGASQPPSYVRTPAQLEDAAASGVNLNLGTGKPSPASLRSAPSPAMRARGWKMSELKPLSRTTGEGGHGPQGWVGEGSCWESSV